MQAPGLSVQLLELHRWSLSRGVTVSGTKLAVEELENTLATSPLDRQAVASQAGILLEAILDRLSIQYQRRLPRNRDSEWTLGDLLNGCAKLFKVLRVEKMVARGGDSDGDADSDDGRPTVEAAMQPFLDDIGPLAFVRNQVGCHFNLAGSDIADADVEAFGKATVTLVKALTCLNCGDICNRPDGSQFRCGCKETRMTPLEYAK